jgi:Plasmid pRiA4b ORF-3-like protein
MADDILTFRASFEPKIYRDIEVPASASLYKFAEAIVRAFGFDFDHAFGFYDKLSGNYYDSKLKYELFADMGDAEKGVLSVKKNSVATAFPADKAKFLFIFDYGDEWSFKVERTGSSAKVKGVKYPRVVKSEGTAPVQYGDPEEEDDNE